MLKKVLALFLVFAFCFSLAACASSPEEVELSSEKEIKKYAANKYGKGKLISTEKEENSITCTFEDKEYGFTYYVKSYAGGVSIDASVIGYKEMKSSDFDSAYHKVLMNELYSRLPGLKIEDRSGSDTFCYVTADNASEPDAEAKAIAKVLKTIDKRGYFSSRSIRIRNSEGTYLGSYSLKEKEYTSYGDEMISQMEAVLHSLIRSTNGEDQKDADTAEFLYYDRMMIKDVPGILEYELVNKDLSSDSYVYVYYFRYKGSEYFVANVKVWTSGDEYYNSFKMRQKR